MWIDRNELRDKKGNCRGSRGIVRGRGRGRDRRGNLFVLAFILYLNRSGCCTEGITYEYNTRHTRKRRGRGHRGEERGRGEGKRREETKGRGGEDRFRMSRRS